jgi:hypothetical protein
MFPNNKDDSLMEVDPTKASSNTEDQLERVIRNMNLIFQETNDIPPSCSPPTRGSTDPGEGPSQPKQQPDPSTGVDSAKRKLTLEDLQKQLSLLQKTMEGRKVVKASPNKHEKSRVAKRKPIRSRDFPSLFRRMGRDVINHVTLKDPAFINKIGKLATGNVAEINACAFYNGGRCAPKDKWGREIACPFMHVCAICAQLKLANTHRAGECPLKLDFDQSATNQERQEEQQLPQFIFIKDLAAGGMLPLPPSLQTPQNILTLPLNPPLPLSSPLLSLPPPPPPLPPPQSVESSSSRPRISSEDKGKSSRHGKSKVVESNTQHNNK